MIEPRFGLRLRALRKARGFSVREACRLSGFISPSTWESWENCPNRHPTRGKGSGPYPSAEKLRKIGNGLDLHEHELFELVMGEDAA